MQENFLRCDARLPGGGQCEIRVRLDTVGGAPPPGWTMLGYQVPLTAAEALEGISPIARMFDAAKAISHLEPGSDTPEKTEKMDALVEAMKANVGEQFIGVRPTRTVRAMLCPEHSPKVDIVDLPESMPPLFGCGSF